MNRGPVIFFSALTAFAVSFGAFVLAPQIQLGRQPQTTVLGTTDVYPKDRSGAARRGAEVYRANGCAYCHSQQIRQTGIQFSLGLSGAGTNLNAVVALMNAYLQHSRFFGLEDVTNGLPKTLIKESANKASLEALREKFTDAGAQAVVQVVATGPDLTRGWGLRRSVAADYLFDAPVLLGAQRIGPDLANVGLRLLDANWQLRHLYNPQMDVPGSLMPPHQFLFEQHKIVFHPSPTALALPDKFAPPAGYEIVPTADALALVSYLQSLRVEAPLFEAPITK